MVYSYSYLSVIFKVSWSTDVAQNFQNSLIRSIHILASLIYSPGICFYDKYKDSFTHVRVLLYIWYGETVHKRKNVNRGPRSNFLAECVPRPIKFGQPCAIKMIVDNFAACCCSHKMVASIVMSFKIMTSECILSHQKYGSLLTTFSLLSAT